MFSTLQFTPPLFFSPGPGPPAPPSELSSIQPVLQNPTTSHPEGKKESEDQLVYFERGFDQGGERGWVGGGWVCFY